MLGYMCSATPSPSVVSINLHQKIANDGVDVNQLSQ